MINRTAKKVLKDANVEIIDESTGLVRCNVCLKTWNLERLPNSKRLRKGFAKCPNCYKPELSITASSKPIVKKWKISELKKASSNVRKDYPPDAVEKLRASIETTGLLQLPLATGDGEVFVGWNRVEASADIGEEEIWAITIPDVTEKDRILMSLAENYCRSNLYDDEVREAIRRLRVDEGMSVREISRKTGMYEGLIYSQLDYYQLPELAQELAKKIKPGVYKEREITKIVSKVPKQEQEATALKLLKATDKDGKPLTQKQLREMKGAVQASDNPAFTLEELLRKARTKEYMTITYSVPDEVYMPFLRNARYRKITVSENFTRILESHLDEIEKENKMYKTQKTT